jgi:hypothetical protein
MKEQLAENKIIAYFAILIIFAITFFGIYFFYDFGTAVLCDNSRCSLNSIFENAGPAGVTLAVIGPIVGLILILYVYYRLIISVFFTITILDNDDLQFERLYKYKIVIKPEEILSIKTTISRYVHSYYILKSKNSKIIINLGPVNINKLINHIKNKNSNFITDLL